MPTVTLTPSACTSAAGWTTLYNYLTTNSSYYPRQLIFTYPANAALGAAGVQINKLTIHGYVRNSASALKRLRFGFRPSASSGVSEWSMRGSSPVLDVAFDAIDGHSGSGYGYQQIERIYVGSGLFINHIRDQFQQGKPLYFGVIQPDSGKSISVDTTLSRWTMTVDYELLGNIPTTDKSSVNLGETLTVNVNRVIGNSSTTLNFKIGSKVVKTADIGTATSYAYTLPSSLGSNFPNSISTKMAIEAVTTLSGTTYGTLSTSVTVSVPDSAKPTVAFPPRGSKRIWTSDVPEDAQIAEYLQWKTGIQFGGMCTALYGATIAKLQVTIEGKTYTTVPARPQGYLDFIHYFTTSGNVSYTAVATDSRGRSTTYTNSVPVLPYSPPQIQAFTVDRATSENVLAIDGTYARATVQASVSSVEIDGTEQNSLKFKIQYQKVGESAWTDCDEVTGSGLTGTFTGLLVKDGAYVSTFNDMSGYDFRAAVYDRFSTSYAAAQMPTKEILWDVDETNTCMGFGGAAPLSSDTAYYRFYKRTEFNAVTDFNQAANFKEGYKQYKTSEVDTGNKWYDGKRIYRFTIHGNTALTNSSGTFYTLPVTPSDIVHIDAFFKSGSVWYPLPWAQYDINKAANIYIDGAKICLAFASGWTGTRAVRVVIEYTK